MDWKNITLLLKKTPVCLSSVCVFFWWILFPPFVTETTRAFSIHFPHKKMLQALDPSTWGAWPVATPQIQSPLLPPCPTTVWWPPWAYESHCHLGSRKMGGGFGGLEAWEMFGKACEMIKACKKCPKKKPHPSKTRVFFFVEKFNDFWCFVWRMRLRGKARPSWFTWSKSVLWSIF